MFADYHHRQISPNEICDQTVKERHSLSGRRQNPTLVNNPTKIGSTLSPEERRLHA
jgi:hypothetical protein